MKSVMFNFKKVACLLGLCFLLPAVTHALPPHSIQYLINSGGNSVTSSGEWAVVGDSGEGSCAVRIYRIDYTTMLWGDGGNPAVAGAPFQTIEGGGQCNQQKTKGFGESSSISGDLLVIGAPLSKPTGGGGAEAGLIYLYQFDVASNEWVERTSGAPDAFLSVTTQVVRTSQAGAFFGSSVSVSGDLVAAGAVGYDSDNDADVGAAYLFRYDRNLQELLFIVDGEGMATGDLFGAAVTTNDPFFLVGAPGADAHNIVDNGAAYLYEYDIVNETATLLQTITIDPDLPGFNPLVGNGVGREVSLADGLLMLAGQNSYPFKNTGTAAAPIYAPEFEFVDSNGGDVSQNNGIAGIGIREQGVDVFPDILNGSSSYHLEIDLTEGGNAVTDLAKDIRLYKNLVLSNDNTRNQAQSVQFECGYGSRLTKGEWGIAGIPCKVPDGTTVEAAFDTEPCSNPDAPGGILGVYGTDWIVYAQDGSDYSSGNSTVPLANDDLVEQGKGYWILSNSVCFPTNDLVYWNVDATVGAVRTPFEPAPEESNLQRVAGVVRQSLPAAQTPPIVTDPAFAAVLVGNPFARAFEWRDVLLDSSGTIKDLATAEGDGELSATAWVYDATVTEGQPYRVITDTPGFDNTVLSGTGFWVHVLENGTAANSLVMPLTK